MHILIGIGVVLAMIVCVWPLVGVPLFLSTTLTKGALATFHPVMQGTVGYAYDLWALGVMYLGGIVLALRNRPGKMRFSVSVVLGGLFVGAGLLASLPMSRSPDYGVKKLLIYFGYALPCLIAPMVIMRTPQIASRVAAWAFWVGVATAVALVFVGTSESSWGARLTVFGASPLAVAAVLGNAIICLTVWWFVRGQHLAYHNAAWLGAIPGLAVPLVLTGSRGEVFATALVSGVVAIAFGRKRIHWMMPLAVFLVASVWLATDMFTPEATTARLTRIDEGIESRISLTATTIEGIVASPIVGNGAGDSAYQIGGADAEVYPHSVILEVANEAGVVVATVFGLIFIVGLRSAVRTARCSSVGSDCQLGAVCFAALLTFSLILSFKTSSYAGSSLLYFWTGCCYAIGQMRSAGLERTSRRDGNGNSGRPCICCHQDGTKDEGIITSVFTVVRDGS